MENLGGFFFGLVIGWVTYRTLRRSTQSVGLSDIATVIAAVGGGLVAERFQDPDVFGWYAIGLVVGFFGYLALALVLEGKKVTGWMGVQSDPPDDTGWGRP